MKRLSPEIKRQIITDIKERYLTGLLTQENFALKYKTSVGTIRSLIKVAMKEMADKIKIEKDDLYKMYNSEEEISKYGIPERDKFKKTNSINIIDKMLIS